MNVSSICPVDSSEEMIIACIDVFKYLVTVLDIVINGSISDLFANGPFLQVVIHFIIFSLNSDFNGSS